MNKLNLLQLKAIKAAKDLNWDAAIEINQQILDNNNTDIGAWNRLGVAFMQSKQPTKSKKAFEEALKLDGSNSIAKKHLTAIKQKKVSNQPLFSREQFIEEPGTTKIVELHRLASKSELEKLAVSQVCELKTKGRFISVNAEQVGYIGALPEDLSSRLAKLMKRGNEYQCFVYSATAKTCKVYIKEAVRSKYNEDINSFPLNKGMMGSLSTLNDIDERFLLEENIPVEIIETDGDSDERTLKDVQADAVDND